MQGTGEGWDEEMEGAEADLEVETEAETEAALEAAHAKAAAALAAAAAAHAGPTAGFCPRGSRRNRNAPASGASERVACLARLPWSAAASNHLIKVRVR
mgnify:CR=1 FL=1